MSQGVGIDEFQNRVEEALHGTGTRQEAESRRQDHRIERSRYAETLDEPRDRFMIAKVIAIILFALLVLSAFLAAPGIGAAGAATGLIVSVIMAVTVRRKSEPMLFDIDRTLRRR